MLTTKQKTLRRFWYATAKIEDLKNGPQPFRLMGEDLVLFLDAEGHPAALADRCCHRTAKLSKGWCENGNIVRSEEHTSELQSLMRISYAVFCLKKKTNKA